MGEESVGDGAKGHGEGGHVRGSEGVLRCLISAKQQGSAADMPFSSWPTSKGPCEGKAMQQGKYSEARQDSRNAGKEGSGV